MTLTPWLESLVVGVIAVLAFLLGRWFSRLAKSYWLIGYLLPLGLILLYCLAMFEPRLATAPPISWMMIGRSRFVCFNVVATMLLTVPMVRLARKRDRVVIGLLIFVLTSTPILPFI